MRLAGQDEPCMFCEQTPRNGAWGRSCPTGYRNVHWTAWQLQEYYEEKLAETGRALSRAAYELQQTADRIDGLPDRLKRKVIRACIDLDPEIIRNEAERARDTLHVERLLDV